MDRNKPFVVHPIDKLFNKKIKKYNNIQKTPNFLNLKKSVEQNNKNNLKRKFNITEYFINELKTHTVVMGQDIGGEKIENHISKDYSSKMLKDNIHGCIYMEPICMKIIDTFQFQRLRNLHQLGVSKFVYPGATHTRFEHSIGVAHLAEKVMRNLANSCKNNDIDISERDILCVKIAGLCHDIGHGPFSHLFESFMKYSKSSDRMHDKNNIKKRCTPYDDSTNDVCHVKNIESNKDGSENREDESKGFQHELLSLKMFDHLIKENNINFSLTSGNLLNNDDDIIFIKELIYGGPLPWSNGRMNGERNYLSRSFIYEIINNNESGLDVDKLDYLQRDVMMTGIFSNGCDNSLLLNSARVSAINKVSNPKESKEYHICFPEKYILSLYNVFQMRFLLHQLVYQHKVTRAIEYMIVDLLVEVDKHIKIKGCRLQDAYKDMSVYEFLDDRILAKIEQSDSVELKKARKLLLRIIRKPYYKCIGKTKITKYTKTIINNNYENHNEISKDIILKFHEKLKNKSVLEEKDFIVEIAKMHYGKGEKNPLHDVYFYKSYSLSKINNCDKLKNIENYEMLWPASFIDISIRIYVRKPKKIPMVTNAFKYWCNQFNKSNLA